MAKTDDTTTDEQTPTTEPIAPQEPSEAVTAKSSPATGGLVPEASEQSGTSVDPFAGFYQPVATIRVGTWSGFPNYECSACPYASLDEAKTQAHLSIHGQTFTQGARP